MSKDSEPRSLPEMDPRYREAQQEVSIINRRFIAAGTVFAISVPLDIATGHFFYESLQPQAATTVPQPSGDINVNAGIDTAIPILTGGALGACLLLSAGSGAAAYHFYERRKYFRRRAKLFKNNRG